MEKNEETAEGKAETFYKSILESLPNPVVVIDRDYNIILKNRAAVAFFEGREQAHASVKCHEVSHGQAKPCDGTGWPCPLAIVTSSGGPVTVEHIHFVDGDKARILEISAAPLRDANGKVAGVIESFRDITRRKLVEDALRESEKRFRAIFENSLDAIILSSHEGKYYAANRAAVELLGYTEDELKRLGRDAITDPEDPNLQGYLDSRESAGSARTELTLVKKGGEKFPAEVSASEFEDGEGRKLAIIVVRDISERRALERQRSDFLAMVTHDLKSPLTAIMGYSELIMESAGESAETVEMAKYIHNNGQKLFGFVEDFVTVSRIEAGRLALMIKPEDVGEILIGLRERFLPTAEKKGIRFTVDIAPGLPRAALDRKQFERVIDNLLRNAFNYTPSGGGVFVRADADSNALIISVRDTGIGIAPEEQTKVFAKYYRSPKVAGTKGTGLGLSVVKAVTEAHGGSVVLESVPGKGSTFSIILPIS